MEGFWKRGILLQSPTAVNTELRGYAYPERLFC